MDARTGYFLSTTLLFVSEGLAALSVSDVRGCCRLHRRYEASPSAMELNTFPKNGYVVYVYDSANKTLEYCRRIAASTARALPLWERCDIDAISRNISTIYSLVCCDSADRECSLTAKRELKELKAYVAHLIAVHSNNMEPQDYDDGTFAYTYLLLLNNLHSLLSGSVKMIECPCCKRA